MSSSLARILYLDVDATEGDSLVTSLGTSTTTFDVELVGTVDDAVARLETGSYDAVVCHTDDSTDGVSFLSSVGEWAPDATTVLLADDITAGLQREADAADVDELLPTPKVAGDHAPLIHRLEHHLCGPPRACTDGTADGPGPTIATATGSGLTRPERQLTALARTTSDALITIDSNNVIHFANPAIEEILGYAPEAIVGESLTTLMGDELAEGHREAFQRYLDTGERTLDWNNVELPASHKDGSTVPVSIAFSEFTHDGQRYFTGTLRDISEKKELLAERELLYDVTRRIGESETFEEGLEIALREVGETMNWGYGEAWVPTDDDHLTRRATYLADDDYAPFQGPSVPMTVDSGEYLPGRVWISGESAWIDDVSGASESSFVRSSDAREVGLQAALGVPITAGDDVVAVLLFLMSESREPDERMIAATKGVAESLGRLVLRKRAEGALRSERDLKTGILETTPLGIAIIDEGGEFDYLNDAAEAIFGLESIDGAATYDDLPFQILDADGEPVDDSERPHRTVLRTGERIQREVQVRYDDGERGWLSVNGAPLEDESGAVTKTVFALEDVTARKERERDLEQAEAMLETVDDGVYAIDDEGRFIGMNRAYAEMVGYDRAALLGEPVSTVTGERIDAETDERRAGSIDADREVATYETTLERTDGAIFPVETRVSLFPMGDDRMGRVGVVRDISARKRREEQLKQLNELAQALTTAETATEVCDIAVETAHETLGLPITGIEKYDDRTGELDPLSMTPEAADLVGEDSLFAPENDVPWQVYAEQNSRVLNDLGPSQEPDSETPLESAMVLPIGSFGVFISGATTPEAFGEHETTLANVLVATVKAALDRVDREETLRTRTEELEERTETLERINRLNSVIRDITRGLTQAATREEIEQTVCTQLANADPYRFVWIGDRERVDGEIVPRASAGVERGYLDTISITADDRMEGNGPAGQAVKTHEPQVQNNLHSDPPFEQWRGEALQRGYRAVISIPLVYRESLYGILNIYANSPGVFDELEVAVLKELGQMIGYAINALERKKAIVSNTAVELQFRITDADVPAIEFATAENCRIDFEALVEETGSSLRAFFTVTGSTPDAVDAYARRSTTLANVNLISERDDGYFYESVVSDQSFLMTLVESGAHPTSLVATSEGVDLTVELPGTGDIQAFMEMFFSRFEDAELVARRELDRPVRTEEEFKALYRERLTERQEEVLRTAYYAGFFNFPRDSSGSDVAEILGVSQPTVNRHIRQSERKLFELVFEDDPDVDDE